MKECGEDNPYKCRYVISVVVVDDDTDVAMFICLFVVFHVDLAIPGEAVRNAAREPELHRQ